MESKTALPHVLVISFPGQGHVNPMLRLAKRVAAKGILITFTTTSDFGRQIISYSDVVPADDGVPISSGLFRLEFLPLEKKCDVDTVVQLEREGPAAFADLIRKQLMAGRPVTYVVNNPFIPWAVDVATDMGIPCAVLWIQSCAVFSIYYHYHHGLVEFPTETNPDISVSLPGIPTMTPEEIPSFLLPSNPWKVITKAILDQFSNINKASWVLINSFTELEQEAIDVIAKYSQIITPVGPLVEPEDKSSSMIRCDVVKVTDDCLMWLDTQAPKSVIYISLGSAVTSTNEEMAEMARGLKTNGRPFLWVVRPDCHELLPQGFQEEIKGRGMVVEWSPQDSVLNHSSVGCFLTHCGWNSTLETLTAGMPVIAYPHWGDQVTDAKFLVDIYKVGIRLKVPVKHDALHMAIEAAMDGPKAEAIRERAIKWKEAAKTAVAKDGSSEQNIQAFVDEVMKRTNSINHGHLQVS